MDNYNSYSQSVVPPTGWYYQPTQTGIPNYSKGWPYYQPQTIQNYQQQPVNNSNMIWVQGLEGAKGYNLPNGATLPLPLWDSENQTIYIKSVDQNGKPIMTILDYVERTEEIPKKQTEDVVKPEYATKEQIDALSEQFSAINEQINNLSKYVTKDQFDGVNNNVNHLRDQIEEIENRITSFGKPQPNNNYRKGNNK